MNGRPKTAPLVDRDLKVLEDAFDHVQDFRLGVAVDVTDELNLIGRRHAILPRGQVDRLHHRSLLPS